MISDLTSLPVLNEDTVLSALESRFHSRHIYTYMASVLIAVNPYRELSLYDFDAFNGNEPHVFGIAQRAQSQLSRVDPRTLQYQPQAIICCGESGSGKTVSTKQIMRYLCRGDQVTSRVLEANPILEAFGNAQTLRNHNSSRFAKFIKMFCQPQVVAAETQVYLLERSRIVGPPPGEGNYHAFYAVHQARHPTVPLTSFRLLKSNPQPAPFESLTSLNQRLLQFNFTPETLEQLWNVLEGILLLGNIDTGLGHDDFFLHSSDQARVEQVAQLWGIDTAILVKFLQSRNLYVRNEVVEKHFSCDEAQVQKESMLKMLYLRFFHGLVERLNQQMQSPVPVDNRERWIGILDVFGFESFGTNSLEQLCINLANEKLQHFFNEYILSSEQAEYRREGLWQTGRVQVTTECAATLSLLEGKPTGVLSLLDSVCVMPKGTAQIYLDNLKSLFPQHPQLLWKKSIKPVFTVKHYAQPVEYTVSEFLVKNNDAQNPDLVQMFSSSRNCIIRELFSHTDSSSKTARFTSVGRLFQQQLSSLMTVLEKTTPYFVRCLNPNGQQKSQHFDVAYIRPQIQAGGIVQAVEMLKYGYPCRIAYQQLMDQLLPQLQKRFPHHPFHLPVHARNVCEALLHYHHPQNCQYQLGITKLFFKSDSQSLLESLLTQARAPLTVECGQFLIDWVKKRRWQRVRRAVQVLVYFQQRLARRRAIVYWQKWVRVTIIIHRVFLKRYRQRKPPREVLQSEVTVLAQERDELREHFEEVAQEREILFSRQDQEFQEQRELLLAQVAEKETLFAQQLALKEQEFQQKQQELWRVFRQEKAAVRDLFESQWSTQKLALTQHDQMLRDREATIEQLKRRITHLERELTVNHQQYREQVVRTYERQLRQHLSTIRLQQAQIRKMSLQ